MNIPTTREEAIAAIVNQDVDRWGDSERAASAQMHSKSSLGLALNTLYARAELAGRADEAAALLAASTAALTPADRRVLAAGG
jgi:hypothetical protein